MYLCMCVYRPVNKFICVYYIICTYVYISFSITLSFLDSSYSFFLFYFITAKHFYIGFMQVCECKLYNSHSISVMCMCLFIFIRKIK